MHDGKRRDDLADTSRRICFLKLSYKIEIESYAEQCGMVLCECLSNFYSHWLVSRVFQLKNFVLNPKSRKCSSKQSSRVQRLSNIVVQRIVSFLEKIVEKKAYKYFEYLILKYQITPIWLTLMWIAIHMSLNNKKYKQIKY